MFRLFYTPQWFNGWDVVFEAVIFIVALLIAAYSFRIYRFSKETRFAYFSLAFLLIAIGFLLKAATSGILYYTPIRDVAADVLRPLAGQRLEFSSLLYRAGFFFQMIPVLGGLLLVFFISQKSRARLTKFYEVSQIALFIYLVTLISIVSNFKYFVFYLTSAVLLGLIVLNYYKNYLNAGRNKNAYQVMWAFLLILLGNLLFVFVFIWQTLYAVAEVLLLLGFLLLLFTYSRITGKQ